MLRRASGAQLIGVAAALAAALLLAACGGGKAEDSEVGTEPAAPATTAAATTSEELPAGVPPKPGVFLHWPFRQKHEPARFGFIVNKRARKLSAAILDCTRRSKKQVETSRFLAYEVPIRDGRFRVTFSQGPAVAEGTFVTATRANGSLEMACGETETVTFVARFAGKG